MGASEGTDAGRPRTAVVLAGGGFKGAFELGALRHLVEFHGVIPDVITATSAGAILGTVAAQARTRAELLLRLDEADGDLMSMTRIDAVFGEQPWLRALDGTVFAERIRRMLTEGGPGPAVDQAGDEAADGPGRGNRRHRGRRHADREDRGDHGDAHPFAGALEVIRRLPAAHRVSAEHTAKGILNLDPFEASLRGANGNGNGSGTGTGTGNGNGVAPIDPSLVAREGLELRLATTNVRDRVTHYVTQDGSLVGPDARTPIAEAGGFDLIDGLIASASVPGVFPPRVLGSAEYVDGGVLANIPLAAAAALGPDRIFTLAASPVRDPEHRAATRVAEQLGYLETQVDNLATPLPDGTTNTVIQPTMLVVGTFEVHPGRMRIDIDYGWLRAQEAVADLDDGNRPILTTASDTIIELRQRAWAIEVRLLEQRDRTDLQELRDTKAAIRSAIEARVALGLPVPATGVGWGRQWELHTRPVPDDLPGDFD
ncbi:MAG: patatin-like phospholipase family protein [Microthrixaceae bacterium]